MSSHIKYRILIIDDEEVRNIVYYKIAEQAKILAGNHAEFELTIINKPQEALLHVASPLMPHYHLVLIDAILSADKNPINRIIQELNKKKIHYALISRTWDNSMADTAREAANIYPPTSWYRYSDTEDDIKATASLLAATCHNLAGQVRPEDPYSPIDILHISDLHFGAFNEDDLKKINLRQSSIIDYLDRYSVKVRYLAITGDLSDNGLPHEFQQADEWVQKFVKGLESQSGVTPFLLTVPGNHDHCVALENAYRVAYNRVTKVVEFSAVPSGKKLSKEAALVADYALTPYREFWHKHHGSNIVPTETLQTTFGVPAPLPHLWLDTRFFWHGLIFYGVNTSSRSLGNPPINKIDADTLTNFQNHLQKLDHALSRQGFNLPLTICPILLMHHPHQELKSDLNLLRSNRLYPSIVLDGHGHSPSSDIDQGKVLVVSSGTAHNHAHRPEDTLSSVNWIRITYDQTKKLRVVEIHSLHYSASAGGWSEFENSTMKYSIAENGDVDRIR